MATVPNFGALAQQQQAANDDATRRTTWSQRPDQSNALGSISWNQDPSGRWINNTSLNGQAQGLFDTTMQGQQGLAGQIGGGINYGSAPAMPTVGGYNTDVINAWNALQEPGLGKAEASQRARLAAQGITQGSNISNVSDRNLGSIRTDAGNKAILAGYQQGNTEFDQALRARAQGTGEAERSYAGAISGMGALGQTRESLDPNKWASKVPTGAAYIPQTIYGAAQDQFNAERQNENADIAKSQATTDSYVNALRAAGGMQGIGSAVGAIAPYAGKAWDWASNYWGGGGAQDYGDEIGALGAMNNWWQA